jgi:hypothetical protein
MHDVEDRSPFARAIAVAVIAMLLPSCSSSGDGSATDTGPPDGSIDLTRDGEVTPDLPPHPDNGVPDTSKPDAPAVATITEQEPNNGATETEHNAITPPVLIQGAIGTADDLDIFSFTAQAGDRLVVEVKSAGDLQPHLAINDPTSALPPGPAVSAGPGDVMAEYYVVKPGLYMIFLRDRRNVGTSQHVGGPSFSYTVSVLPLTRPPVQTSIGSQQSSSLSPAGTIRVFAFSAVQDDLLDLSVQVGPSSSVDARLTLFHTGQKSWHGTNEDPLEPSALLQGKMPFSGTYHAIVENVSGDSTNLDFSFSVAKQAP